MLYFVDKLSRISKLECDVSEVSVETSESFLAVAPPAEEKKTDISDEPDAEDLVRIIAKRGVYLFLTCFISKYIYIYFYVYIFIHIFIYIFLIYTFLSANIYSFYTVYPCSPTRIVDDNITCSTYIIHSWPIIAVRVSIRVDQSFIHPSYSFPPFNLLEIHV